MTVFVSDSFTDANGTLLENHAPGTGGAWVKRSGVLAKQIQGNKLTGEAFGVSHRYTNNAAPGSAEYDVQASVVVLAASPSAWYLFGRWVDIDNHYAGWYYDQTNKYYLHKRVEGVWTELDLNGEAWADGTFKLELRDNSQKLYLDAAEKCSSVDEDLTEAGLAGLGGDFDDTEVTYDNFQADDVAVSEEASMTLQKVWWQR